MIVDNMLPSQGNISGSIGGYVICKIDGRYYARRKSLIPQGTNSASQKTHRNSFKLMVDVYQSFGGITNLGFTIKKKFQSPFNRFVSTNLPWAIEKTESEPVIDYSKLVIANGVLNKVRMSEARVDASGIKISYHNNQPFSALASDEVVAVAKTKIGELLVARQPKGSDAIGTILLPYPNIKASDVICCYLFVLSADGKKSSNSVYVTIGG